MKIFVVYVTGYNNPDKGGSTSSTIIKAFTNEEDALKYIEENEDNDPYDGYFDWYSYDCEETDLV